jgi:hypothetical protein
MVDSDIQKPVSKGVDPTRIIIELDGSLKVYCAEDHKQSRETTLHDLDDQEDVPMTQDEILNFSAPWLKWAEFGNNVAKIKAEQKKRWDAKFPAEEDK